MRWAPVDPVVDHHVRALCARPYAGHPRGCPNFNKAPRCPGAAPLIETVLDLQKPVWAIWNNFDFGGHVNHMRISHPGWSLRQLECCLYWQGTAKKELRWSIDSFELEHPGLLILNTPEAAGVNITETMAQAGIILEWPPRKVAYQVVLAGTPTGAKS